MHINIHVLVTCIFFANYLWSKEWSFLKTNCEMIFHINCLLFLCIVYHSHSQTHQQLCSSWKVTSWRRILWKGYRHWKVNPSRINSHFAEILGFTMSNAEYKFKMSLGDSLQEDHLNIVNTEEVILGKIYWRLHLMSNPIFPWKG